MHNSIATSLQRPWSFSTLECPTIQDAVNALNGPSFAGGVITMPYKQSIIPHLSGIDKHAALIGAVNNVYISPEGKLRGTNTDWEGIKGCLLSADASAPGQGKPALIIGAGGASRAAVYALKVELGVKSIYVINRDDEEVRQLLKDTQSYGDPEFRIIHVKGVPQAKELSSPYYVVGTVPDFEPKTEAEIEMRRILEEFLGREDEKGVLLDMCFKPRKTRTIKLARGLGWRCVEGTGVIGYQIETQWSLWTGEDIREQIDKEEAWRVLNRAAEESTAINF